MDNNTPTDYDAMFRASQKRFSDPNKPDEEPEALRHERLKRPAEEPVTPEVLDSVPQQQRRLGSSGISPEITGIISVIIGVVAFILIFIGMFAHFIMWLNLLIILTGIGFGIAALIRKSVGRLFGIIGVVLGVFDLLVQLICMIIVIISSGVSALFKLIT